MEEDEEEGEDWVEEDPSEGGLDEAPPDSDVAPAVAGAGAASFFSFCSFCPSAGLSLAAASPVGLSLSE